MLYILKNHWTNFNQIWQKAYKEPFNSQKEVMIFSLVIIEVLRKYVY